MTQPERGNRFSEVSPLLNPKFPTEKTHGAAAYNVNVVPDSPTGDQKRPREPRGTLASSVFNLMMSAVGAGMLSYPFAMASTGILACVLWTLLFGALVIYSLLVVVRYAEMYAEHLEVFTYEELVFYLFGKKAYIFTISCVLLTFYGSMVGFTIIIGDVCQPLLHLAFGNVFWSSRVFAIVAFMAVVVLPLSFVGNIHDLVFASVIGIGSVLMVSGLVIYRGSYAVATATTAAGLSPLLRPGLRMFLAPPICVFALGCHLQVVPIWAELREEAKLKGRMSIVVTATQLICIFLYSATGLFGYVLYGPETDPDILSNFVAGDIVADVSKFVMAVHITLAFPMSLLPMKRTTLFLLQQCGLQIGFSRVYSLASSVVILFCIVIVAIFVPQVAVVFGLTGSTTNVAIMFILPALFLLSSPPTALANRKLTPTLLVGDSPAARFIGAWSLIIVGSLLGVVGTFVNIQQTFFADAF